MNRNLPFLIHRPDLLRRGIPLLLLALLAGIACQGPGGCCQPEPTWVAPAPSFDGSSDLLASTVVVPTLDTPMPAGKNVIWCASFALAWQTLQDQVVGAPLEIGEAQAFADRLNAISPVQQHLPDGAAHAAAGVVGPHLLTRITEERSRRFPDAPDLQLDAPVGSLLAYAYLEAHLAFERPFFDNDEPLLFRESPGTETPVASFGLRTRDQGDFDALRNQVQVLWAENLHTYEGPGTPAFVLDLDKDSTPSQLLVARIDARDTLADTLAHADGHAVRSDVAGDFPRNLDTNDILLVPGMNFRLSHHFAEIEGPEHTLLNAGFESTWLDTAQQDIAFRLDKSGADLKSESLALFLSGPSEYVVDRPFLVVMRLRGADLPYFVMWVENPELLIGF